MSPAGKLPDAEKGRAPRYCCGSLRHASPRRPSALSSVSMENKCQSQLVAVRNRVQNLKDAKRAENQNAAAMGMNTFLYDQLLAINQDLINLYQTQESAKDIPATMPDAQPRRPSGR